VPQDVVDAELLVTRSSVTYSPLDLKAVELFDALSFSFAIISNGAGNEPVAISTLPSYHPARVGGGGGGGGSGCERARLPVVVGLVVKVERKEEESGCSSTRITVWDGSGGSSTQTGGHNLAPPAVRRAFGFSRIVQKVGHTNRAVAASAVGKIRRVATQCPSLGGPNAPMFNSLEAIVINAAASGFKTDVRGFSAEGGCLVVDISGGDITASCEDLLYGGVNLADVNALRGLVGTWMRISDLPTGDASEAVFHCQADTSTVFEVLPLHAAEVVGVLDQYTQPLDVFHSSSVTSIDEGESRATNFCEGPALVYDGEQRENTTAIYRGLPSGRPGERAGKRKAPVSPRKQKQHEVQADSRATFKSHSGEASKANAKLSGIDRWLSRSSISRMEASDSAIVSDSPQTSVIAAGPLLPKCSIVPTCPHTSAIAVKR
jgi:hypothetical protein